MYLSPSAERALCAYLTQVMLNDEASHHTAAHLSSPTHINPGSDPYLPLSFDLQDVPTLPDWYDAMDDFDRWDFL